MFTMCFGTRNEAERACDKLHDIINLYNFASINDLIKFCGDSTRICYLGEEYGWTSDEIAEARVEIRPDHKHELILPEPTKFAAWKCNLMKNEEGFRNLRNLVNRARKDFVNEQARNTICSSDPVNHPEHYKAENGLEVIDVIEAFTQDLTGMEAVCTANAIKYILRWKHKNGVEDLKKARWYISKLIDEKENEDE